MAVLSHSLFRVNQMAYPLPLLSMLKSFVFAFAIALECPEIDIDPSATDTTYDETDVSARIMDRNYAIECLDGYAMITEPDLSFSDEVTCKVDETATPIAQWEISSGQDNVTACKGIIIYS